MIRDAQIPCPIIGNGAERSEFAEQVTCLMPFLRRAVRRWHCNKPDADDLLQDTLLQALANAHLWQPGSDLRAWLFTIMRNLFFAGLAKSNRAAAMLENCATDGAEIADPREARLMLRDVNAALQRLPPKQRTAVLLAGVEGKSYEETAAAMGLTVGAVRCQLARGRNRLRAAVHGADARSPCAQPGPHPYLAAPIPLAAISGPAMRLAELAD